MKHIFQPDPDDLLGQACLACPLGKSNTSVHIDLADLPAAPVDGRYEVQRENPREEQ